MSEIQRWKSMPGGMGPSKTGEYVRFSDHENALRENDATWDNTYAGAERRHEKVRAEDQARVAALEAERDEQAFRLDKMRTELHERGARLSALEAVIEELRDKWSVANHIPGNVAYNELSALLDRPERQGEGCPESVAEAVSRNVFEAGLSPGHVADAHPVGEANEPTRWWFEGQWWVRDREPSTRAIKPGDVTLSKRGTEEVYRWQSRWRESVISEDCAFQFLRPARTFECSDGVVRVESGEVREVWNDEWYFDMLNRPIHAIHAPHRHEGGCRASWPILVPLTDPTESEGQNK